MIQSLKGETTKSEDMFVQLQEIQVSVRLAFLNCFLDFAGIIDVVLCFKVLLVPAQKFIMHIFFLHESAHLEHIATELAPNKSSNESTHLQNGYSYEGEEASSVDLPGSVVNPHQRLLIVLSNIGYCKDELSSELYNKYSHIWLQSRYDGINY